MISVRFQAKPFNITVIQVYAPTSNAEEADVEQFYEDLQDLLGLTQCPFVLCFHPQVFLRKGVRASRSYQEQTGKSGSFACGTTHEAMSRISS